MRWRVDGYSTRCAACAGHEGATKQRRVPVELAVNQVPLGNISSFANVILSLRMHCIGLLVDSFYLLLNLDSGNLI